jgi:hypothetical protein
MGITRSWIGGLGNRGHAGSPLSRLTIDDAEVTLGPSARWLHWFVPTYRFPWSSVETVEATRANLMGYASIRFTLIADVPAHERKALARVLWPSSARHPIFWCWRRDREAIIGSMKTFIPHVTFRDAD